MSADLVADESEDCGDQQTKQQCCKHHRLEDEDDVPRVPAPVEWQKRPDAVVVSEIEQNVAENGQNPKKEQQSPARREGRRFAAIHSPAMKCVDEAEHDCRIYGCSDEGMGKTAMGSHRSHRSIETPKYVHIGEFCGESDHQCRVTGSPVESCASDTCAGKKVSDRFHTGTFSVI